MSGWVICPIFCSSVMVATIARTFASSAESGVGAARFGQGLAADAAEARSAVARHTNTRGRTGRTVVNPCIQIALEVVTGAEEPRSPVLLEGLQRLHPTHVEVSPIRGIQHVADLEDYAEPVQP